MYSGGGLNTFKQFVIAKERICRPPNQQALVSKELILNPLTSHHLPLSRRNFLRILAAAGTTAAAGHVLFTYAPWMSYSEQVEQTWHKPFAKETTRSIQMREIVRCATLAANSHNSQPWRFAIQDDAIQIHPDYSRHLPAVDPYDRVLWLSLGCALENLVIAAQTAGYACEIGYPENGTDYINVSLQPGAVDAHPFFDAISIRQSTRSLYDGRPVPTADLDKIMSMPLEQDVSMQVVTADAQREAILEYIKEGDQRQYGDQAFVDELVAWLRFNKSEAMATLDGLFTRCTGNPEAPRWIGKLFVNKSAGKQQAQTDEKNYRSSSGVVIIVSEQDNKTAWVDTGRVYERLALNLTALGIKSALLNQPIEVADLRIEFQHYLEISPAVPQLIVRFGYADPMPRSLRRPVQQVLL